MSHESSDFPPASPTHPALGTPTPKRRRRWWVYVLWVFGSLMVLGIALFVSAILYWNSLVKKYTTTTAKALPQIELTDDQFTELQERWQSYALLFIRREGPIPPFELSGEELNLFARRFGPFRKHAYAEILDTRLRLQFSVPLDESGNPSLKGRFLNGIATFNPEYKDGRLRLKLVTAEANNKAIPRWILSRLQSFNWAEALNRRPEFDLAIRAMDRIELQTDKIILYPAPVGPMSPP